jgi:redox-sensitive bicupin YhaK (pirin superfamily)
MERRIKSKVKGYKTQDGAGVHLVRVLSRGTVEEFDPILMLDSFDSTNPDDYTAGFPLHPHRGIETISYLSKGKMVHKDTLGNTAEIGDGEVQWMNAGSGLQHEEDIPESDRVLGVQLWLNLPREKKMSKPSYTSIHKKDIEEISFSGGYLRLIAGDYEGHHGFKGEHLPLDYYDIHLDEGKEFSIETPEGDSLMIFTLLGEVMIGQESIEEKTAVKLTDGDSLKLKAINGPAQILYLKSKELKEPVAWAGPIVMNTREELKEAFNDLETGNFIRDKIDFED